ncbi:hypothetical protein ANN_03695 [Periplaneta americana]|uniref:Uncharacterized protein n=1 Tax=Periplaneta americana TaxID=6978 RepID=A0ABQ8U3G6_PERAM|nr:hypothetical protein ANN_03695 [Periplaneta americana]
MAGLCEDGNEPPGSLKAITHVEIILYLLYIYGHHALSCARSKGRIPRHTSLNDIIKRSLTSCGIPSLLEPPGISRADGKRPDGLTLISWSRRKSLIWDSTCVDTLAPSHLPNTSRRVASAAELDVKNKVNKYAHLLDNYIFVPFGVETFGSWNHDAKVLVSQIGQILISITERIPNLTGEQSDGITVRKSHGEARSRRTRRRILAPRAEPMRGRATQRKCALIGRTSTPNRPAGRPDSVQSLGKAIVKEDVYEDVR